MTARELPCLAWGEISSDLDSARERGCLERRRGVDEAIDDDRDLVARHALTEQRSGQGIDA